MYRRLSLLFCLFVLLTLVGCGSPEPTPVAAVTNAPTDQRVEPTAVPPTETATATEVSHRDGNAGTHRYQLRPQPQIHPHQSQRKRLLPQPFQLKQQRPFPLLPTPLPHLLLRLCPPPVHLQVVPICL